MTRQRTSNRQPGPLGGDQDAGWPIRWTPLPSALDGRRYVIRGNRGGADRAYVGRDATTGVMQVPLDESARARRIRLHEMAHVRWTPAAPPLPAGVSHDSLNAVEDCRMHKRLREVGLDAAGTVPLYHEEEWDRLERSFAESADPDTPGCEWTPLKVAQWLAATIGTTEEGRYRGIASGYGHGWVLPLVDDMAARYLGKRRPAFKRAVEFAVELEATFAELEETIGSDTQAILNGLGGVPCPKDGPDWGTMEIVEVPTSVRLPRGLRTKVRRSTDSGSVPRYWHRVPIDGRVFAVRRFKPQGGTVLIDQSGSMSLNVDDVQAIMSAYPAVTIATYAGSGARGQLRIIAQHGERAADDDCMHPSGGNIIDGPALEWLADQPEPRVWVSDGMVTGAYESQNAGLVLEAARIVKRGRIMQVYDLADVPPGG